MDARPRARGAPIKSGASVRKETMRDSGAQFVKSLLRSRKDLCRLNLELPSRDGTIVAEVHFVCLPGQSEGDVAVDQALASLPAGLREMLRNFHVHGLRNDEVQMLKDSRSLTEHKDAGPQCWLKAVCVLRHNPGASGQSAAGATSLAGLLGRYVAGIRYAVELQSLRSDEARRSEEDDTNRSVSSIEDDFVTALENLEEVEMGDGPSYRPFKRRDVASQTVPAHKRRKELSGTRIIIGSSSKKYAAKHKPGPEVSVTVQRSSGMETQWTYCSPGARLPSPTVQVSQSEESDCSSPSPIIFLDEVGYQKSMLAKLDIPQVPGGPRERVEDSDSEVSEFFDSFDQFDDLEDFSSESGTLTLPMDNDSAPAVQTTTVKSSAGGSATKYVSKGCSTKDMYPHCFDQPILPANVKKPTPLKLGSPYGPHSEVPDSPRPVQSPSEDNGGPLFSPINSSAFSPLVDSSGVLEYFWKRSEDGSNSTELRKPQDLCSLYKTYSDFANSLSKEILGSVCGYQSAIDINDNKNLSCVCQKKFTNSSGYTMKLSEIQETVTVAGLQKSSQSLKDGIQRFAADLVEMSLGSALRDLQKGVSICTTTLCQLAARLTSSVFQMAFHEIGMRQAYVLKERAVNGLANFLVGEAVSGALKEFLTVKKQVFHSTVTQFAADLAEELLFEGIMEVCQFSHPSTPLTPSDWSCGHGHEEEEEEEEEEVVTSYASDLSESVIQEAFIELSQADIAFTSQAAISVSPDNICYVRAENMSAHTCSTFANQELSSATVAYVLGTSGESAPCTVKEALFTVSGMASCIPVPQAGQAISHLKDPEDQHGSSLTYTSLSSPKKVTVFSSDNTTCTQTHIYSHGTQTPTCGKGCSLRKSPLQNFSGNMVDTIVTEACELISASKMKKHFDDCAGFLAKAVVSQRDTLDVPNAEMGGQKKTSNGGDDATPNLGQRSGRTPGTPPSTPQQPSEVSKEKQIKLFSKKLKSKLAKEFSPATPPPTPHYHTEPGPCPTENSPEADKTEFMLKLMRSLSEEADGNVDEEEEELLEDTGVSGTNKSDESEGHLQEVRQLSSHGLSNKEALHYAEQLACHIVSMATEIDALGVDDKVGEFAGPSERRCDSVAHFSEQTLNTLWVYAGEVAGEVINDVKRMLSSVQQRSHHGSPRRRSVNRLGSECLHHDHHQHHSLTGTDQSSDWRVERVAEQWSNNLLASVFRSPVSTSSSSSSGLSSAYPSCESVTDEYAGYLIRVLKKEGGNRELVLDQYASRLAYRSIKQGLAHASRKIKQRSSSARLYPSKSLPDEQKASGSEASPLKDIVESIVCLSCEDVQCCCRENHGQRDCIDLVNFAESLAYKITCDVTRMLRLSSVRLPKSLTDSCLYKKSNLENVTENLIRNSFSCPLLSKVSKARLYHSTGSLLDAGHSNRMMPVIEHYAKKIVDDTLKMSLASVGHSSRDHQRTPGPDRLSHTQRLSEGTVPGPAQGETTCCYCQALECPYCTKLSRHHHQSLLHRRRRGPGYQTRPERLHGLEIPKIHIDLEHRSAFAEQMVSMAMENAKRELSNTSLNADSGISHDGTSYADSVTAEVMTSALNVCQAASVSSPGREATESTVSQQLSVGDDSLGSWSNLSFEDDNSSFLHLSDSNGNSSSWSSLGLEGEPFDERMSSSPSDSDHTEDKEGEVKEESSGTLCDDTTQMQVSGTMLIILNSDSRELRRSPRHLTLDPQLRSLLQWAAASVAGVPLIQLSPDNELQQLPAVVQRLRERKWRVGELLHFLLRYCEETQPRAPPGEETPHVVRESQRVPLFKWLLEHT
ncbi:A-kinase anchor protein 11 isoform X2 [Phycodurus eques]|uniref:A-kinase anchor protein 11 isoform X2 n=1 Tax=Phycodurus eques TaxID=693459 RepID=UPI002ACD81B7|nr:A-kinase anchor protein 11 isoform X2 [Phycodurus eques]XP_061547341.1 A-kinase anchor protein 11 isoform X2 [Phycodurus eques]XP_061547343.1 A-kinase anchor protein 11 isoform X2 [Phycodurus eques]